MCSITPSLTLSLFESNQHREYSLSGNATFDFRKTENIFIWTTFWAAQHHVSQQVLFLAAQYDIYYLCVCRGTNS